MHTERSVSWYMDHKRCLTEKPTLLLFHPKHTHTHTLSLSLSLSLFLSLTSIGLYLESVCSLNEGIGKGDFPIALEVKNPPCNEGAAGSIPNQRTKIPQLETLCAAMKDPAFWIEDPTCHN